MKQHVYISRREAMLAVFFVIVLIGINYFVAKTALHHCNVGIAFGVELPISAFVLLWTVTMIIVMRLFVTSSDEEQKWTRWGCLLILCGGIANIADRILHGCVIDYIQIIPWNVFNLADASITIGAMMILWSMHVQSKKSKVETEK